MDTLEEQSLVDPDATAASFLLPGCRALIFTRHTPDPIEFGDHYDFDSRSHLLRNLRTKATARVHLEGFVERPAALTPSLMGALVSVSPHSIWPRMT